MLRFLKQRSAEPGHVSPGAPPIKIRESVTLRSQTLIQHHTRRRLLIVAKKQKKEKKSKQTNISVISSV